MESDHTQSAQSPARRLISIREAAAVLGVCPRTMYRLIASGDAPSPVKVGRATRLVLAEVDAYIAKLMERRR